MRKIVSLFLAVLLVGVLSGCTKSEKKSTDKTKETTSQTTQRSDSSTSEAQTSTTESITEVSTVDDARKLTPDKEASILRRELYEAGINSSEMSDAEIEEYAVKAKEENLDFITYIQEKVLK
ncbi:hypothetical protein [Candidatus Enterococcus clewellii]|uniref:Lipoprotein n=1 Tax=Candidatus Enterococcus clewellii TaxID=1834193 RepID=A0A242JUZ8_9ENTE|nr:hypothetical protein [Enterococcus sp. 9E7_DIV0242]OTP06724.1 hypothetical protein A5888_004209 [Enterococcus sp. 9E7_DIV0242]